MLSWQASARFKYFEGSRIRSSSQHKIFLEWCRTGRIYRRILQCCCTTQRRRVALSLATPLRLAVHCCPTTVGSQNHTRCCSRAPQCIRQPHCAYVALQPLVFPAFTDGLRLERVRVRVVWNARDHSGMFVTGNRFA